MSFEEVTIGQCRLIRGDAREVLPTLALVDAVITDPPYGVELAAKRAHLSHGRSVTTVRKGSYSHPDTEEYLTNVVLPIIAKCQTLGRCMIVMPGVRHLCLYPQPDDIGCFFSPAGTGMGRWGFTCMQPILYYGTDPFLRHGMGSRPNSHGQIYPNDANEHAHPCAKPLPMMLWLVNRGSLPGHTILDPFAGSFTTGVACAQMGRAFVGIEIEQQYFDIGCQRIEDAYRQLALFAPSLLPLRPQQEPWI